MKKNILYLILNLVFIACNKDEVITFDNKTTQKCTSQWDTVFEYTPAPGQFINDTHTSGFSSQKLTPAEAVAYATKRLSDSTFVSLGGFGGYIVVGFDHNIINTGEYEIAIKGNSFNGSSEPGIVYVMQDENNDGLPNDTWFELQGSETFNSSTIQNYSITYYHPKNSQQSVKWSDNQGNFGEIDYLSFHQQDYYYPAWITESQYTLTGTCLSAHNYDNSNNESYWVNPNYDWGYADNFSSIDRINNDMYNYFKISNAINDKRELVHLDYINFVKIQTAVNTKSGWLGESSTEILNIKANE